MFYQPSELSYQQIELNWELQYYLELHFSGMYGSYRDLYLHAYSIQALKGFFTISYFQRLFKFYSFTTLMGEVCPSLANQRKYFPLLFFYRNKDDTIVC